MAKPSASAMAKAERYIQNEWGNDGGAVAETAGKGLASVDKIALRTMYGKAATEIGRALVLVCREHVKRGKQGP